MTSKVKDIIAYGTSGSVLGKKFNALYRNGFYELHSEELSNKTGKPLNYNATKVFVPTLEEAAKLILKGGYHLRLKNAETGQENKRKPSEVEIIWA